mmetsp:Transcript_34124/g.78772  ORF Transcript_34124/g.78772 Transcript_34124/m.78772 type:complete len:527 (-) Transcript_34124:70-1650(-)
MLSPLTVCGLLFPVTYARYQTDSIEGNTDPFPQSLRFSPNKVRFDHSSDTAQSSSFLQSLVDLFIVYTLSSATTQTLKNLIVMYYNEVKSKLVSEETASAFSNIAQIIREFSDHGVVNLKMYPKRDVLSSIIALSRLQSICKNSSDTSTDYDSHLSESTKIRQQHNLSYFASSTKAKPDDRLLDEMVHYAAYANAAYGWKGGLALSGKFHLGDLQTLIDKTGIRRDDVIEYDWTAATHRPAYYIVRDSERKNIILCIRGTWSARDVLTDLCATAEDFSRSEEDEENERNQSSGSLKSYFKSAFRYKARAHRGMLAGARSISKITRKTIANELAVDPNYRLVIVGHSLGAGIAAILGSIWLETFPGLKVFAYGCPCVGPPDASPTNNESIISVVDIKDPFSTLSLGHIADITIAVSKLCEDRDLREEIHCRCKGDLCQMSDDDVQWCGTVMRMLEKDQVSEKFYPAGRVFCMGGAIFGEKGKVTLEEVSICKFRHLILSSYMMDVSKHVPNRYESALKKFWRDYNVA